VSVGCVVDFRAGGGVADGHGLRGIVSARRAKTWEQRLSRPDAFVTVRATA